MVTVAFHILNCQQKHERKSPTPPCETWKNFCPWTKTFLSFKILSHTTWNVSHVQPSTEHFICNSLTVINWATPETLKCHIFTYIEMTVNATVVLLVSTWQSDIHHRFAGSPHVHPCPGSSLTWIWMHLFQESGM